uniref:Protein kinase domain-containing protein n=1 Tax=Amphiprion percula TaxID=161767 RepID=A0A3P8RPZ8_AMPPE
SKIKGNTLGTCHVVEDILGEGAFGVVAKCRNTETQKSVAVKVNKGEEGVLQQAIYEIAVLKRMQCLDHDICNIVQWDGFFFDKENICITFELLDMSLRGYMEEQDRFFTIGELKPILHQLATALASLHSIGITHMDLKPDNIMVVDRSHQPLKVKLIDFGLARPVSALHQGEFVGTRVYRAPEMLLGVPFDESVDMWALGLVMAELAMGCCMYPGNSHYDMVRYIVETQGQPPDDLLDNGLSVMLKSLDEIDLIKSMLNLDASNRITAQQVLDHEFFDSGWCQCINGHQVQMASGKKLQLSHSLHQDTPELETPEDLIWAKKKKNWTVAQIQNSLVR